MGRLRVWCWVLVAMTSGFYRILQNFVCNFVVNFAVFGKLAGIPWGNWRGITSRNAKIRGF